MCDICVINAVKERMLSRRSFFAATSAAAAGAALSAAPAPALAAAHGETVDMTHAYDGSFPTWGGAPGFSMEQVFNFKDHGYNLFNLAINEHTGTHIDAPLHFSEGGASVDEIPAAHLVCPLAVIDISARAAEDPDTQVTPDDITAWTGTHGPVPAGACVAMLSGWDGKTGGDGFRNADGAGKMHFPGFHPEAAQMLIEDGNAVAIAVDTLSLDHGPSADFGTHYTWLPSGRYGIECIANLGRLPASGATLVVGAPKHRGGSGGPARVLALA